MTRLNRQVFQVVRNEWRTADPVSGFENGEDLTKLASRHIACNPITSHSEKGVANFTVKTLSERASVKGIVKDHGPCVAMQEDIKIVAFYGSISKLGYPKVKIWIN